MEQITIEHVSAGSGLPNWIIQNFVNQYSGLNKSGNKRIMVLYPNEKSRKEGMKKISEQTNAILDSSQHQTIIRLTESLVEDLRIPRRFTDDSVLFELVHNECTKLASSGGFPLISSPRVKWNRSKTRLLTQLHTELCEENIPSNWEGDPGLNEFVKVLSRLEKKLQSSHPNLMYKHVIKELIEIAEKGKKPFTLADIDGIIMMNHAPTLSFQKHNLLQIISRFCPIHQLCNSGRFRPGFHGAYLKDVEPCRSLDDLPHWIPQHDISSIPFRNQISRIALRRTHHSESATIEILKEWCSNNTDKNAIIIDPRGKDTLNNWNQLLKEIGVLINLPESNLLSSSSVHWLIEMMKLGYGEDAWAAQKICDFAEQTSLPFSKEWVMVDSHPWKQEWSPKLHSEMIIEMARGQHLLGGRGSLERWLWALGNSTFDSAWESKETLMQRREESQWWLLSIATRLKPLLSDEDRIVISNKKYTIGCASGEKLPLPKPSTTGDDCFSSMISNLDWAELLKSLTFDNGGVISGLQQLIESHNKLREMQMQLGHKFTKEGEEWIEELSSLLNNTLGKGRRGISDQIRVLSPKDSLGCTADLVILPRLTHNDWALQTQAVPWLDSETRNKLGILRPDNPIREARHYFNHILNSAEEVIVFDPSFDESNQPASPLAEWLSKTKSPKKFEIPKFMAESYKKNPYWISWPIDNPKFISPNPSQIVVEMGFVSNVTNGTRARDLRQRDGELIRSGKSSLRESIYPPSLIRQLSFEIVEDRQNREPVFAIDSKVYLEENRINEFVSTKSLKIISKTPKKDIIKPRYNDFWPVIGQKTSSGKYTPSIDLRPLTPSSIGLEWFDKSHGYSENLSGIEKIWSATRLANWIDCPRKGWLESRLKLTKEEVLNEDIDFRERGSIVHESLAELMCSNLNIEMGIERENFSPSNMNVALSNNNLENMMSELIDIALSKATWLKRKDAVAEHRRRQLLGMDYQELQEWISNPESVKPKGILGELLISETNLVNTIVAALEWRLCEANGNPLFGIDIDLPPSPEIENSDSESIRVRGMIDRVEILPDVPTLEIDESNTPNELQTIMPLDTDLSHSINAKRLVIIRDLKSVEKGKTGERHSKALLEEVQLALYARAWEITHPGDRVVGVGISEVGTKTNHFLECDPQYSEYISSLNIGTVTSISSVVYRRPGETSSPNSNPFRAWIRQRLQTSIKASRIAKAGTVTPTPNKGCSYCSVKKICGLSYLGGDRE